MSTLFSADKVEANLTNVRLSNGLVISEIALEIEEFSLSAGDHAPASPRQGNVVATLTEAHLSQFLDTTLPSAVKKVEVQLVGGRIQVAAIAKVVFDIKALALMHIELVDGKELNVILDEADPFPARGLIESQIEKANPIFNAADLPFEVTIERTEIEAGLLKAFGTFRLPEAAGDA